jgi:hypothetical protein
VEAARRVLASLAASSLRPAARHNYEEEQAEYDHCVGDPRGASRRTVPGWRNSSPPAPKHEWHLPTGAVLQPQMKSPSGRADAASCPWSVGDHAQEPDGRDELRIGWATSATEVSPCADNAKRRTTTRRCCGSQAGYDRTHRHHLVDDGQVAGGGEQQQTGLW